MVLADSLIIGIGSPFGEDNIGWEVVRKLPEREGVTLLLEDRPGVTLLEKMAGFQQVILVDAVVVENSSPSAGKIHTFNKQELVLLAGNTLSSHSIGVAETIALGAALGIVPEQLLLIGVEISMSDELGKLDQALVTMATEVVERAIDAQIKS